MRLRNVTHLETHWDKEANAANAMRLASRVLSRTGQAATTSGRGVSRAAAAAARTAATTARASATTATAAAKSPQAARIAEGLKRFMSPKTAPSPGRVADAAKRAAPTGRLGQFLQRTSKAVERIANVPKGERFAQRPVSNTRRLLTLDGVPGVRRINQAALLGTAGVAALEGNRLRTAVNQGIDSSAERLGDYVSATPEQRRLFKQDMHTAKWRAAGDQTLGQIGRALFGSDGRSRRQDELIRATALEGVKQYYNSPANDKPQPGTLRKLWANRTPLAAVGSHISGAVARNVPPPKNLGVIGQLAESIKNSDIDTASPTALEQTVKDYFGDTWNRLTPAQQAKVKQDVQLAVGAGAAATGVAANAVLK